MATLMAVVSKMGVCKMVTFSKAIHTKAFLKTAVFNSPQIFFNYYFTCGTHNNSAIGIKLAYSLHCLLQNAVKLFGKRGLAYIIYSSESPSPRGILAAIPPPPPHSGVPGCVPHSTAHQLYGLRKIVEDNFLRK